MLWPSAGVLVYPSMATQRDFCYTRGILLHSFLGMTTMLAAFFEKAKELQASDLHLVAGELPMVRLNGELQAIGNESIDQAGMETEIMSLMDEKQKRQYEETHDLDMGYTHEDTRFRLNVHQQDGKIGVAARRIPGTIPTPDQLGFESTLLDLSELSEGLVLVVGPTGQGKSTTIASMINEINKKRKAHIVTIEDPIEFVFRDEQCLIEQREVGTDTVSFAAALKHVLRQDPDVIFVGEMRDPETIATALTAAETGHLVFSTLHTSNAAEAIERIVDVFEGAKQKQVLIQLGAVLRAVVAQQLIPGVDGKLIAVREVLINTSAVSNLIRENNIAQITSAMQTGAKSGMVTMENALKALVESGKISEEAMLHRLSQQKKV